MEKDDEVENELDSLDFCKIHVQPFPRRGKPGKSYLGIPGSLVHE